MSANRRTPFRPRERDEITQNFNDGMATIFQVGDGAPSGYRPDPTLTELIKLPYQERKVGIKRYYSAKQNQIHIERVIRVPVTNSAAINSQQVIKTEDSDSIIYRIDLVQLVTDVYPQSLDLTLTLYTQNAFERPTPPTPPSPIDPEPVSGPSIEGGDGIV